MLFTRNHSLGSSSLYERVIDARKSLPTDVIDFRSLIKARSKINRKIIKKIRPPVKSQPLKISVETFYRRLRRDENNYAYFCANQFSAGFSPSR